MSNLDNAEKSFENQWDAENRPCQAPTSPASETIGEHNSLAEQTDRGGPGSR